MYRPITNEIDCNTWDLGQMNDLDCAIVAAKEYTKLRGGCKWFGIIYTPQNEIVWVDKRFLDNIQDLGNGTFKIINPKGHFPTLDTPDFPPACDSTRS